MEFPPPAFIGDIVRARVIILDNNGGYGADITPKEFPDLEACDEFRQMLAAPRPVDPTARSVARYYLKRNYSRWLISGEAALVNGVAYRSADGNACGVKRLTKTLPSAQFHRNWLRDILAPLAVRGERFVVVHRSGRWNSAEHALQGVPSAIFSSCPRNRDLTPAEFAATREYLRER